MLFWMILFQIFLSNYVFYLNIWVYIEIYIYKSIKDIIRYGQFFVFINLVLVLNGKIK